MGDQDFKVPSWVDEGYLEKVLHWKFPDEKEEVKVNKLSVEVGTNKGDGFASEMFRLVVESSKGTFPLILKKPHGLPERLEITKPYNLFYREISFYKEIYPALKVVLQSVDEYEEFAPELFYGDLETDVLILRDLRGEGYKTGDRQKRVESDQAKIVLRKLAKMHASSLILNQKWDGSLAQRKVLLFDGGFNETACGFIEALTKDMKSWGSDYVSLIPKLEATVDQYGKLAGNNLRSKRGLNVMIHADLWYNNMMFKDGDSSNALLIDFQTTSWGSLAIDLVYFTITSLSSVDFEKREEFIEIYHSHLERVLKKLKWENVPTFEDVLQEYKDKFYHSLYSVVAKAIISDDPSQQSLETMADDPLRKLRNPLINQELRTIVKLLEEYGTLDTTETEES